MFDRLVEPLAEPKQARGHTLVGDGKDLTITLRFVHGLEEELGCLGLRMVRADAREPHERPCPLRARSQLRHRVAKLCFRPRRVPRLEVKVSGVHCPAVGVRAIRGCQLACAV